jgi:hypothetical protein
MVQGRTDENAAAFSAMGLKGRDGINDLTGMRMSEEEGGRWVSSTQGAKLFTFTEVVEEEDEEL